MHPQFLDKLELAYDLAILLLGVDPRELKQVFKQNLHENLQCSVLHSSPKMQTTHMCING